jgi:tetratricopeptide (TPR) repeat protein
MFRIATLTLFGIIVLALAANTTANPPDDVNARIAKALAVQSAMARARMLLVDKQSQKAVELLEEQLPNVNGSGEYLMVLRDAYRTHIKDLYLAGQPAQAKRYYDRLCIIDPGAANDVALRPQTDTTPRQFEVAAQPEPKKPGFPMFKMPPLLNPFAKKEEPQSPLILKGSVTRAHSDVVEDPFAAKNQRETPAAPASGTHAQELLVRGAAEFKSERYAEARVCFEQAYQVDKASLDAYKAQWAYCIIKGVSVAIDQPGTLPAKAPELKQQVETAIGMAPTNLMAVGQALLQQIEQRSKGSMVTAPLNTAATTKVKHWGQNKEGWQVAETPHFRIFHRKDNDFAERVAAIVESTRVDMYKKWFNVENVEWQPCCELILHATGGEYTHATGVPGNSPGHSRIETDRSGRIIARRMDLRLDINGMMEAVLPHETTHIVLAGMFGNSQVPRWADEGIAVLTEPDEKIDLHRRNLLKHYHDNQLFALKELMELKDYPHHRRIGAFYAQSVVLAEFLAQKRGPKVLTDFIIDGVRQGYDAALQKHYSMTFAQLEQAWQQEIINNPARFTSRK